jgi:hypothetical protein
MFQKLVEFIFMRIPISNGLMIEMIIAFVCIHRALFYGLVTLDNAIAASKESVRRLIGDMEGECDKFSSVLASLEDQETNPTIDRTKRDLVEHIYSCTSEISELWSFVLKAGVVNILRFGMSQNHRTAVIVEDIFRTSSTPSNGHKCKGFLCIDWASAFDIAPFQQILLSYLPLATSSQSGLLAVAAMGTVLSGSLLCFLARSFIQWCLHRLHPSKLSSYFLVLNLVLSRQLRFVRITVVLSMYLTAFTVCYDSPSETMLFRIISGVGRVGLPTVCGASLLYWSFAAVLILKSTWLHERLTVETRSRNLAAVEKAIACVWLESGVENLRRLKGTSLIRILNLVEIDELPLKLKREISLLILSDPFLAAVYSQRGAYSEQDQSNVAWFTRQVRQTLHRLGHREYPWFLGVIIASMIIVLPLLS